MAGWYYTSGDDPERHDPVTWEELLRLAASGKLRKDDAVWRPSEAAPVVASQVPGLFSTSKSAPSPSSDEPPPFPAGFGGKLTPGPEEPPPFPPKRASQVKAGNPSPADAHGARRPDTAISLSLRPPLGPSGCRSVRRRNST